MLEVCRHNGLLDDIINDQGLQFVSDFWKYECKLSLNYHPENDNQINVQLWSSIFVVSSTTNRMI